MKDKGATKEDKNDYLSELGKANYNINVHHGEPSALPRKEWAVVAFEPITALHC